MFEKNYLREIERLQKCALDLQGNWKKSSVNEETGKNHKGLIFSWGKYSLGGFFFLKS